MSNTKSKTDDTRAILELQSNATLIRAEAAELEARANRLILQRVRDLGGAPGVDGICLRCGVLIPQGQQHQCAPA